MKHSTNAPFQERRKQKQRDVQLKLKQIQQRDCERREKALERRIEFERVQHEQLNAYRAKLSSLLEETTEQQALEAEIERVQEYRRSIQDVQVTDRLKLYRKIQEEEQQQRQRRLLEKEIV